MIRFSLTLSIILLTAGAQANIGRLPVVNPERTVSVLELYGVVPTEAPRPVTNNFSMPEPVPVRQARAPAHNNELLIPNRPSGDLWSRNANAEGMPLRMPLESEFSIMRSDDFLHPQEPLEHLSRDHQYFASARTPPPTNRVQTTRPVQSAPAVRTTPQSAHVENFHEPRIEPRPEPRVEPRPVTGPAAPAPARTQPATIRSTPQFVPAQRSSVPEPVTQIAAARQVELDEEFAFQGEVPLTRLSPTELRRAFRRTFTTENQHLSTYQIGDRFDSVSFDERAVGFDSNLDLSERGGGIRPLEIKISFHGRDSSLSRDNYNLITEYAGIVTNNPKRAVQVSIPERMTRTFEGRTLAARRLAIIEQVLRDSGVVDRRIVPVLSQRNDDAFVLRVISNDTFHTLTERRRDMFGDTTTGQSVRSLSW